MARHNKPTKEQWDAFLFSHKKVATDLASAQILWLQMRLLLAMMNLHDIADGTTSMEEGIDAIFLSIEGSRKDFTDHLQNMFTQAGYPNFDFPWKSYSDELWQMW